MTSAQRTKRPRTHTGQPKPRQPASKKTVPDNLHLEPEAFLDKPVPAQDNREVPPAAPEKPVQPASARNQGALPVNEKLRKARENKRYTMDECAQNLRIRRSQLQAIEDGHYDELPSFAHGIGFIRSYAEFLGLDSNQIAEQYKATQNSLQKADLSFPIASIDQRTPSWKIIVTCLIVFIVTATAWNLFVRKSNTGNIEDAPPALQSETEAAVETAPAEEAPELPQQATALPQDGSTAPVPAAAAPAPVQPEATGTAYGEKTGARINLYAEQDSWLQIRDSQNQVIFSRILRAGDSYNIPQNGFMLTTGNAGGLKVTVDGQTVSSLGNPGQIIKNISLNPEQLKAPRTVLPAAQVQPPETAPANQEFDE